MLQVQCFRYCLLLQFAGNSNSSELLLLKCAYMVAHYLHEEGVVTEIRTHQDEQRDDRCLWNTDTPRRAAGEQMLLKYRHTKTAILHACNNSIACTVHRWRWATEKTCVGAFASECNTMVTRQKLRYKLSFVWRKIRHVTRDSGNEMCDCPSAPGTPLDKKGTRVPHQTMDRWHLKNPP